MINYIENEISYNEELKEYDFEQSIKYIKAELFENLIQSIIYHKKYIHDYDNGEGVYVNCSNLEIDTIESDDEKYFTMSYEVSSEKQGKNFLRVLKEGDYIDDLSTNEIVSKVKKFVTKDLKFKY